MSPGLGGDQRAQARPHPQNLIGGVAVAADRMIECLKQVTGGAVMTADPLVDPPLVGLVAQGQHGHHPGSLLVALNVEFKFKQLWRFLQLHFCCRNVVVVLAGHLLLKHSGSFRNFWLFFVCLFPSHLDLFLINYNLFPSCSMHTFPRIIAGSNFEVWQ